MLSNPNFDSNLSSWTSCGGSTATTSVNSGELLLDNGGCVYQEVPAIVGITYKLSCDAKRSGATWTSVYLAFSNSNFATLESEITPVTTTGYDTYSVSLTAPADAAQAVAVMYAEDASYFDNCALVVDDGSTDPATENLIRNGGFEFGLDGWFSCANANNVSASNVSNSGAQSASVKSGGCLYQEARAEAGASYTLSCEAKDSAQSYTALSFNFSDASYQTLTTDTKVVDTSEFAVYSSTLTAPANTRNAVVVFYSEGDSNFDTCSLVKN